MKQKSDLQKSKLRRTAAAAAADVVSECEREECCFVQGSSSNIQRALKSNKRLIKLQVTFNKFIDG